MKKLLIKDRYIRKNFKLLNIYYYLLKLIITNNNFFFFFRNNALVLLTKIMKKKNALSCVLNYCFLSKNKKRLNKYTFFSRYIFLKKLQNSDVIGFLKSTW